jgi:hypothetical protein
MSTDVVVDPDKVLVELVDCNPNGEIGWRASSMGTLTDRLTEIRAAIRNAAETVAESLSDTAVPAGWSMAELSASFGLSLAAEGGVIVTKATAGTTFDVTVTFRRDDAHR